MLVGGGLHLGGESLEVGGGLAGVADEHHGRGGQPRNGREVRDGVIRHLLHDVLRHEMDVGIGQKRRAIGRGTRDLGGAQRVVGARAVLDHPSLAERVLETVRVEPANGIDGAAGCSGNDKADIAALLSGRRARQRRQSKSSQSKQSFAARQHGDAPRRSASRHHARRRDRCQGQRIQDARPCGWLPVGASNQAFSVVPLGRSDGGRRQFEQHSLQRPKDPNVPLPYSVSCRRTFEIACRSELASAARET